MPLVLVMVPAPVEIGLVASLTRPGGNITGLTHFETAMAGKWLETLKALEAPIRQIAENAGVEGSIVVGRVRDNKSAAFGFNAQTEECEDMLQAGIVDPAKVVRAALQDAASVAGLLITTEAMVAESPKKESAPAMPGGGGMGGMGGGMARVEAPVHETGPAFAGAFHAQRRLANLSHPACPSEGGIGTSPK